MKQISLVLLLLLLGWGATLLVGHQNGRYAIVEIDGKIVDRVDLTSLQRQMTKVYGADANENVVQFTQHSAAVMKSNCRDQICVRAGVLKRKGDAAVCLPHQFVLRIEGDADYDGMAQ